MGLIDTAVGTPGFWEYMTAQSMMTVLMPIVTLLLVWAILGSIFKSTSSGKARKLITDLYVIGMIRQFAEKDGINIEDEMRSLRKLEKLERMSYKDLDVTVETELQEKIVAENEKKLEQIRNGLG